MSGECSARSILTTGRSLLLDLHRQILWRQLGLVDPFGPTSSSQLGCFRAGECDETFALSPEDQQASSSYFSNYR